MRVVTLIENTTGREDLACEHGLSLYIETGNHKILFDAGESGAFADNARKLGIDLTKIDFAVLSHGHDDHGGGLVRFLEINDTAPVYISANAFGPYYNARDEYIGLYPRLLDSGRIILVGDERTIAEGITLHSCNGCSRPHPMDTFGLTVQENNSFRPDGFLHEQYLLIEEGGKRICVSGCSHKGILNIEDWFRPDLLIGGFHFMKLDPEGEERVFLAKAAEALLAYPTTYYTGHCTGAEQYAFMKQIMGDRLHSLTTGLEILY